MTIPDLQKCEACFGGCHFDGWVSHGGQACEGQQFDGEDGACHVAKVGDEPILQQLKERGPLLCKLHQ